MEHSVVVLVAVLTHGVKPGLAWHGLCVIQRISPTRCPAMKSSLHYLVAARQHEIASLEQVCNACMLVTCMSQLIHTLQKERGLSNMFLASAGAQGAAQRLAQLAEVDAAVAQVCTELDRLSPEPHAGQGARLFNAVAYTLQGLDALSVLRKRIDQQLLSPDDSTAAFVRIVSSCLVVVFEAADSASDPDISRMLVAMFHFMQGKELAGQERAAGTAAFASGRSHQARQSHWLHLIESQERCFEVFAELATLPAQALWQRHLAETPELAVVERLRRVGCTAPADAVLDESLSATWFAACSCSLDAMFGVEVHLARALDLLCQQKLQVARSTLAEQQRLLAQYDEAAESTEARDDARMRFFAAPSAYAGWPLEAACALPMGRSVLSLVHEQALQLQRMQAEIEQTKAALHERKTVERAKGLLMQYRQLSESEAHKFLRQTAMNQNKRMLDVAQAVLSMAELFPASLART